MTSHLDVSALESWRWEAACVIRGLVDAPKFKDDILPLIFLKRLSDVFDDDIDHWGACHAPGGCLVRWSDGERPALPRWPPRADQSVGSMKVGGTQAMTTPKIQALGITQHGPPTCWKATGDVHGVGWLEAWGTSLMGAMGMLQALAAQQVAEPAQEDPAS
jgi:HsdM N-terminal domain